MFAAPAPAEASITLPDPSTVIVAAVNEPLADLIILGMFYTPLLLVSQFNIRNVIR
jgi:hypothetical protein